MRKIKKGLALLLALAMMVTLAPTSVFAEEITTEEATEAVTESVTEAVTETTAEAPETEAAPEDYVLTGSVNGINVVVEAPAEAFPNGAELQLTKVAAGSVEDAVQEAVENASVIAAVDIAFIDNDGAEVEPAAEVNVKITLDDASALNNDVAVVHVPDEGEATTVDAVVDGDTVEYTADEFSVYAIVDPNPIIDEARASVVFHGINDAEVATYYVKNGDVLLGDETRDPEKSYLEDIITDPGIGGSLPSGQYFLGWYVGNEKDYTVDTAPLTIGGVRSELNELTKNNSITQNQTINVWAMIFKVYSVTYLDEDGISLGSDDKYLLLNQESVSYQVTRDYEPSDPRKNFEGWKTTDSGNISNAKYNGEDVVAPYKMGTTMTISGSVTFTVEAPSGKWLVFDENGKNATYTAPQFVKDGENTVEPDASRMARLGYEFVGWYTEKYADNVTPDPSKKFVFGSKLPADAPVQTFLYAKWNQVTSANYTVIYWKMNVAGDGYDFSGSQTVSGTVGSTVSVSTSGNTISVTGAPNYSIETGFSFNAEESDTSKTVAAEGNTVVNVYIKRNEYTLNFQVQVEDYTYTVSTNDNDNNPAKYGDVNGQKARIYWNNGSFRTSNSWNGTVYNGTVYTRSDSQSWQTVKSITALYEQNISEYFPIVGDNGITYNNGERWDPQSNNQGWSEVMVYIDTMPNESVNFHLDTADRPLKTMNYYVEALSTDTENIVTRNGVRYTLYNTISALYNGVTEEDFVDLDGFNKVAAASTVNGTALTPRTFSGASGLFYIYSTTQNQSIYFFYSRKKYEINFMDGRYFDGNNNPMIDDYPSTGQFKVVENVIYGSNISSYNKEGADFYEPTCKYPGFVFEGWYIDDACTTPYTFNTMTHGITVYAKWRQIQYRVFLHPNAKLPNGTNDNALNWGSEDQAMNFRISYRGTLSAPTGTRGEQYTFIGWFTDEATTKPFNTDSKFTEEIVKTDYDKEDPANYTDPMNKFGEIEGQGYNSDLTGWDDDNDETTPGKDRFWITKKMDLYGKWSAVLTGARGIGIIYDANGGSGAPTDTKQYKDNVDVIAQAASTAPQNQRFLYWVVQKWNGTEYEDTDTVVYPGATFTALKSLARETDLSADDPDYVEGEVFKAYTMQLRAEYGPAEASKDTHIDWYRNYDSSDTETTGILRKDENLLINQAVTICPAPTREGYEFLGWARENERNSDSSIITYYPDLGETDLYLKWIDNKYQAKDKDGNWVDVTEVAADEALPYHALYAVWEALPEFYVYHSGENGGNIDTVYITSDDMTYDLTQNLTANTLYGGYYLEGGFTMPQDKAAYDGSNWTWTTPQTENGKAIHPVEDTTYYVKEVPSTYLDPNLYVIWDTYHNVKKTGTKTGYKITNMYLMTAVDDANYNKVGYTITGIRSITSATIELGKSALVNEFKITKKGEEYQTLTADSVYSDLPGGLLLLEEKSDYIMSNAQFQDVPYWITPDGLTVTGAKQLKGILGNAYYYEWQTPGIRKTISSVNISVQ